jgi:hypothetical protein
VTAYAIDPWTDFGVGVAGASAPWPAWCAFGLINAWVLLVEILR